MIAAPRRVAIIDYGVGNLLSVVRALQEVGADARLESDPRAIAAADRVVLPGVGAFGACVDRLRERGLADAVLEAVAAERPVLGICVGMQMLLEIGEEFGEHQGLGLVPGRVRALTPARIGGQRLKIPNIGWVAAQPREAGHPWEGTPFAGTTPGERFYVLHSFAAEPSDPASILAQYAFGDRMVCAAVAAGSVTGVQFHPEKSGPAGLRLLERFVTG